MKSTLPVFDICSVSATGHDEPVIAERFADYLSKREKLFTPHRHSFYHLVLFTSGSGTHTIDFQQFTLRPGQIYFMTPGQVHSWDFAGEVDGYVVNFSDHLFHSFLANEQYLDTYPFFAGVARDSVIDLDSKTLTGAIAIMEQLIAETAERDALSMDMVRIHLLSLFIAVSRSLETRAEKYVPHQNQQVISNFRKLVNQHFAEKKLPKDYAAMLFVTPNHLNAICNELLGLSAGDIIRDRVLLEAKRLLVNADASIADIAYQLGFADNSYFGKFFKKYTGATPDNFRRAVIV